MISTDKHCPNNFQNLEEALIIQNPIDIALAF